MANFSLSEHVTAPPGVVFNIAADFHNGAKNIQSIESLEVLSDGPIGVGTRFRETRTMMGKSSTEEMEISAFDPPHSYVVETDSCGCHFRCEYRFVGDIAGTNVRLTFDTKALTFFAKLMSPFSSLMMGTMKNAITADLADLKRAAEKHARELEEA